MSFCPIEEEEEAGECLVVLKTGLDLSSLQILVSWYVRPGPNLVKKEKRSYYNSDH